MNENDIRGKNDSRNDRDSQTDREVSSCGLKVYGKDEGRDSVNANVEDLIPDERDNISEAHSWNTG